MTDENVRQALRVLTRHGFGIFEELRVFRKGLGMVLSDIVDHYKELETAVWCTRDNQKILYRELADSHLLNILGCYDRGTDIEGRGRFQKPLYQKCKKSPYYRLCMEAYRRRLPYIGKSRENKIFSNIWDQAETLLDKEPE